MSDFESNHGKIKKPLGYVGELVEKYFDETQRGLHDLNQEVRNERVFKPIIPNGQVNGNEQKKIFLFKDAITEETPENRHLGPLRIPPMCEKERWKQFREHRGDPLNPLGFLLTTDDGTPERPEKSIKLAEELRELGITGHFFICGYNKSDKIFDCPGGFTPQDQYGKKDIERFKKTEYYGKLVAFIKEIGDQGHFIHNHTWNHTNYGKIMSAEDRAAYLFGIKILQIAINDTLPRQHLRLFRYPYGAGPKAETEFTKEIQKLYEELGIHGSAHWNHDTMDWKNTTSLETIEKTIQDAMEKRGIFLMHDKSEDKIIPILRKMRIEQEGQNK